MVLPKELPQSVLSRWFRPRSFSNPFWLSGSVQGASPISCVSMIRPRGFQIGSASVIPSNELPLSALSQWFRPMSSPYRLFLSGSVKGASPKRFCLDESYLPCRVVVHCTLSILLIKGCHCVGDWGEAASPIGLCLGEPSNDLHQSVLLQWFRPRIFTNRLCSSGSVQGASSIGFASVNSWCFRHLKLVHDHDLRARYGFTSL